MKMPQLLENARNITGSHTATGQRIGASSANISDVIAGRRELTDDQCTALADLLKMPWWAVVAASNAAKAERRGDIPKAAQWRERMTNVSAPLVLAVMIGLFGLTHTNEASARDKSINDLRRTFLDIHYGL